MVYIPEKHKKYDLLPCCRKNGGEVFEYPFGLHDMINARLPEEYCVNLFEFISYEEFFDTVDRYKAQFALTESEKALFDQYKIVMKEMNTKEKWSVCKYLGKSGRDEICLTIGRAYYWPYSKVYPGYNGVIDDEEYTAIGYPVSPEDWEILEDPFGMAYRTLYERRKPQKRDPDYRMKQIERVLFFKP